jgi:hypothetical protein
MIFEIESIQLKFLARELRCTHFLTVVVLRLSRKCDHPAFNLCLQFIRRTYAGERPLCRRGRVLSLCSRSSLAPAAARAAYLPYGVPPPPSLRTSRRQRRS